MFVLWVSPNSLVRSQTNHVLQGLSFLSIPFMYPSEINNQRMRNTGNAVAMITNWVFVYVIVLITPTGELTGLLLRYAPLTLI
jgi:Sugar (and other) transporter